MTIKFVLNQRAGRQKRRLMAIGFVIFMALMERSALATCGDYLLGSPAALWHRTTSMTAFSTNSIPEKTSLCTGAECHRDNSTPSHSERLPQSRVAREVVLIDSDGEAPVTFTSINPQDADFVETPLARRIFRPPRAN